MRARALGAVFWTIVVASAAVAQVPAMPVSQQMRFVDFHRDLARSDVVVVVGTLGKGKEGRRERIADGQLGGLGRVMAIGGTTYFKVPVQAPVQVRATFAGKPDKPVVGYEVQLARLPDGKEQRQSTTGTAAPMDEGMLALFVMVPGDKKKGLDLVHVIPFDKNVDKGADAEAMFLDTMADFVAVNRRMLELENAIAALDKAADAGGKAKALAALQEVVTHPFQPKVAANDGLVTQHVAPLEQRAKKRIADAAAPPPPAVGDGK